MSDTQQSLSRIRENYEKIRNDMERNDLNDIISDSSDELFAGLKEIVFSKKNTVNIQNDIRRIARSLEDKYKRLEKDDDKYTQEISDIATDKNEKNTEISTKKGEITTNDNEIANIKGEIQSKATERDNYESQKKQKKTLQDQEKLQLKQKNQEILQNTDTANKLWTNINKTKTNIQSIENDIEKKKNEINRTENNIRNKQRDISILDNKVKNKENEKTKIERKMNELENKANTTKNTIEKEKIKWEIEELEKKKNNIETEIKDIETNKGKIEDEIKILEKNIKDIESKIEKQNQDIETEKNNLTIFANDLRSKEAEIDKNKTEKIQIEWNIDSFELEKGNFSTEFNEKKSEIDKLNNEIEKKENRNETLKKEIKNIENDIKTLNDKLKDIQEKRQANQDNMNSINKVIDTHKEIAKLSDLFDIDKDLKEQKIKPNTAANANILDGFLRDVNQKPDPLSFEIYDGENKKVSWNKIKNIKLKDGKIVNIEWITINNNGEIVRNNAKVTDAETDKSINNFPIEFEIEIGAKTIFTGSLQQNTPDRNITITNKKTLKIKIDVDHLDQDKRKDEINAYNNSGRGHIIEESLTANHDNLIARLEREAFYRALERADGPKFNKLSDEQKFDLYQEVRNMYRTGTLPRAANLANMNNFNTGANSFVERFSWEKHESNKPEFTINPESYRVYIHNNMEEQIKKYFERRFNEVFSENLEGNTYLKAQLTNYLTEIERQKMDNDVHQDILGDIDDTDRMENRRRHAIDIGGRTYGIGRRDVNYLRFFAGKDSNVEIKDQTVNITTNNRPEDLNNPEPVKYDMDMEVSGKQQILVNVKIGKQKEIKLKAWDPAAMVRTILRCEDIQHGKVRAHIVYNVIKGFIQSAKKKDLSLTYRHPETGDTMVIKMDGNNIVLEQQDNQTNFWWTYRRNTNVLFDYQYFENTNNFDSMGGLDNRKLRVGIDRLMGHFNFAMNELHYQYRQASERRRMGLRRWETRMTLPTSIFLSPIKKLLNFRTTTNFDFATTVQSNGKSISIDFKKNKFTFNMDGLKKPISSRTLGKLLRHREWGVRIFDGMERDICGKIYEELIKKMRENTKIARTNFWVKDCITGRTYILDSDGELWYVNAEQAAANPEMIRRGRLSRREYGIVDNPPAGRTMCDESETREVMKNPFLMGRLIKTMNNRMGIISSTRALVN